MFSIFSHKAHAVFAYLGGLAWTGSIYQIYLLIFSVIKTKIYVMYKDLNHLSLTIADKMLGVASHFSLAVHVRARPVDRDILVQANPSRCGRMVSRCSAFPVPLSHNYVSKALDISGSIFRLLFVFTNKDLNNCHV